MPIGSPPNISESEIEEIQADARAQREHAEAQAANKDLRRHPVYTTIRNAQGGFVPSRAELDELKLPTKDRLAVEKAIGKLTALREAGEFGEAHKAYAAMATEIVGSLPADMRASNYLAADEPPDTRGPDELAADVARW